MRWQRPQVRLDDDNRAFWTGGRDGVLLIHHCDACDAFVHPPIDVCPRCLSESIAPKAVAGTGTIDTFTVNHQQWAPGMEVPLVIARVRLDDAAGVVLTTNIVGCPADEVAVDDRVRVVFEAGEGVWYPLFEKTG